PRDQRGRGRARRDDLLPLRAGELDRSARGAVAGRRRVRPLLRRPAPSRVRGVVSFGGRRACGVDQVVRRGRRDRERAAGICVPTGLFRSVLLRPGRDKAGDRPRPATRSVKGAARKPETRSPPPPYRPNMPTDVARLPIPGNAEFLLYVVVLIIA